MYKLGIDRFFLKVVFNAILESSHFHLNGREINVTKSQQL